MERVMITLPEELLRQTDDLAQREGHKRSQLIRQALEELLERRRREAFEALLAEGYRENAAAANELVEAAQLVQAEALAAGSRWDDRGSQVRHDVDRGV